jgi:hypothetical protein
MPYSKEELLAFANGCATQHGLSPITECVLESWIHDKLLNKAKPHGHSRGVNPTWLYSDYDCDTVRKIVELKALGAKRHSQLVICLWTIRRISFRSEIIVALKSEFSRIVRRQERGRIWWSYQYNNLGKLSEAERAKLIARLPVLDPDLAATGLTLSDPAMLETACRAYWGSENGEMIPEIVLRDLANTLGLPPNIFSSLIPIIPLNISGALGPPDESANGGYEIVDNLSQDDLETARALIFFCFIALLAGKIIFGLFGLSPNNKLATAYGKAADSILTPEWIIPSLALFAISAFHFRTAKKPRK